MIHPYEITIGSLLRTNKGDVIKVESISTNRQHRKVGYHTHDDPYRIKYVRLAQCEGIELTPEILEKHFVYDKEDVEWKYDASGIPILNGYNSWLHIDLNEKPVSIRFVHEFQFILICAGLTELAMNLKVE